MRRITRGQAIREKCIDCCCGSRYDVKLCPVNDCPLWRYRLGFEDRTIDYEYAEDEA